MMKNKLLCFFALTSLALSFFFDYQSSSASEKSPVSDHTISLNGSEIFETYTSELEDNLPSYRDSLFYNYYAQNLGVNLDYTEDKALIETIYEWIGTPYRSGASSKKGTDCSGFVSSVYKEVYGINLSRSSRSMFHDVQRIKKDSLRAGDLIFFKRAPNQPIYHVGIYLKDNKFVHSATNGGVIISSLNQQYYRRNYFAAGRVN
jgi:probable lipoprotein NlpC